MTKMSPALTQCMRVRIPGARDESEFPRTFRIGRSPENDVVLDDDLVSLEHAEVVLEHDEWVLRDLGSTNGTIVGGKRIDRLPITRSVLVRFGHQGPAIVLTPEGLDRPARPTRADAEPSESQIARRYLKPRPSGEMSRHTAMIRRVFQLEQQRRFKKYVVALVALGVLGIAASAYAYRQHQRVEQQRAAAADLFYATKALELEIAQLQLSTAERQAYRERQSTLEQRYRDFLEEMGVYSPKTPERVQLIYRVVHNFGESEVNVPKEFIQEVERYIERWRRRGDLEEAIARAQVNGYGPRIAEIMLEHDMPPEFFYLALQESNLKTEAVGRETRVGIAKGMWQFMPATARQYGLRPGPLVGQRRPDPRDDRHDFEKSTRAAARYLRDIYTTDAQASGLLVMASYNWGQGNVIRLIRAMPANPRDRNFWKFLTRYRDRIPAETYGYVFSIVSAAVIGENPQLFGFAFEPPLPSETGEPQPVVAED